MTTFNEEFKKHYLSILSKRRDILPLEIKREIIPYYYHKVRFETDIINKDNFFYFCDVNQNFKCEKYLNDLQTFSKEELELVLKISDKFEKNNLQIPKNGIISSIKTLRSVKKYLPKGSLILDFGSGSGLDAIALALSGYKVISYDITTSLFIYQNYIYKIFFDEDYLFCEKKEEIKLNKKILHIPFFLWFENDFKIENLNGVITNYVINEISPISFIKLNKVINDSFKKNYIYLFSNGPGASNSVNFYYIKNFGFKIINSILHSNVPNYVFKKISHKYQRKIKYINIIRKFEIILNLFLSLIKKFTINKKANLELSKENFISEIKKEYPNFMDLNQDEKFVSSLGTSKYGMDDIRLFFEE